MHSKKSKLIFIDSEINTSNSHGTKIKLLLPPHQFSVQGEDSMRLTVLSFDLKRDWLDINRNNNIFYIFNPDLDLYTEVEIEPGTYSEFHLLAAAIQTAIRSTSPAYSVGSTCTYDAISRRFTFQISGASANTFICTFQVKTGTRPAGVSERGFFNDSHEILGLNVSLTSTPKNGTNSSGSGPLQAPFVASLNSIDSVYLRTNLMGNSNYQTLNHEKYLPDGSYLTESNILARFPLETASFSESHPFVKYHDSNNLFSLSMDRKHLDSIELYITDSKGRIIGDEKTTFKCVLRWEKVTGKSISSFYQGHISEYRNNSLI